MRGWFRWLLLAHVGAWDLAELHHEYRNLLETWLGRPELDQSSLIQSPEQDDKAICAWGLGEKLVEVNVDGCALPPAKPARQFQVHIITLLKNDARLKHASCMRDLIQNETNYYALGPISVKLEAAVVPSSEIFEVLSSDHLTTKSLGDLKPGEVGDFFSHVQLWRQVVESGIQDMIVLEDDAKLTLDFVSRLSHVYADLPPDWDIAWFFESPAVRLNENFNHPPTEIHCKANILQKRHGIGTNGYIISQRGAARLLELALPIDGAPVDLVLHYLIQSQKINAFVANPPLVYDDYKFVSVIQGRHYSELRGFSKRNFLDHLDLWRAVSGQAVAPMVKPTEVMTQPNQTSPHDKHNTSSVVLAPTKKVLTPANTTSAARVKVIGRGRPASSTNSVSKAKVHKPRPKVTNLTPKPVAQKELLLHAERA